MTKQNSIHSLKRARKLLRKAELLLTSNELSMTLAREAEHYDSHAAKDFYEIGIALMTGSIKDDLKLLGGV